MEISGGSVSRFDVIDSVWLVRQKINSEKWNAENIAIDNIPLCRLPGIILLVTVVIKVRRESSCQHSSHTKASNYTPNPPNSGHHAIYTGQS